MRLRSAVLMSSIALTALALAGCSGEPAPESTPTSTAEAAGDLCGAALPEGKSTDGLTIGGEVGAKPTLDAKVPLEIAEPSRVVVTEGDGDELAEGDWFEYSMAIFDATTGELAQAGGFDAPMVPIQASAQSGVGQLIGCATVGTRIAVTIPGSEQGAAAV